MQKRLTLLLGGVRSGKSAYAEQWAKDAEKDGARGVLFVATAQAFDDEMRERIDHHRASRPVGWHTLEAPLNTGAAILVAEQNHPVDIIVVDCMTLLASNVLLTLPDDCSPEQATAAMSDEASALLDAYEQSSANWFIVTNEVGMGVVPPSRLGRLYRDGLGRANQLLAARADRVLLFVAGLAWQLKPAST